MSLTRRAALAGGLSLAALGAAHGQAFPVRPLRIVVPFPPGGATDVLARIFAQHLTDRLAQQVIVENRPGASGNIGAAAVAQSAKDGYTLLFTTMALATAPATNERLAYDVTRDLAPLSIIGRVPLVLVVNRDLPVTSFPELVVHSKAEGVRLLYATPGNGTPVHLATELLRRQSGLVARSVPYANSARPDLLSGRIQISLDGPSGVMEIVRSGQVRALGHSSSTRLASLPDIAPLAEVGVPGFDVQVWYGFLTTSGVPDAVRERLTAEIRQVAGFLDVQQRLTGLGVEPASTTEDQFRLELAADIQRWREIAAGLDLSAR